MHRISLTDFVDIVSKSGTPKATNVAKVKNRPKYEPAIDFYKPLRERIIDTHKNDLTLKNLEMLLPSLHDGKKIKNYSEIVKGYSSWWGKRYLQWFDPPSDLFAQHGLAVSINPELGLIINDQPYLIKLYFKADPLTKNRIDIATHLMEVCLRKHCQAGEEMTVLDVRNSKLILPKVPIPSLSAALEAEMAYIATLWPNI
ncbi:MAG: hypothetical protein AB9919_13065 [Geobacteraceae bacterium]